MASDGVSVPVKYVRHWQEFRESQCEYNANRAAGSRSRDWLPRGCDFPPEEEEDPGVVWIPYSNRRDQGVQVPPDEEPPRKELAWEIAPPRKELAWEIPASPAREPSQRLRLLRKSRDMNKPVAWDVLPARLPPPPEPTPRSLSRKSPSDKKAWESVAQTQAALREGAAHKPPASWNIPVVSTPKPKPSLSSSFKADRTPEKRRDFVQDSTRQRRTSVRFQSEQQTTPTQHQSYPKASTTTSQRVTADDDGRRQRRNDVTLRNAVQFAASLGRRAHACGTDDGGVERLVEHALSSSKISRAAADAVRFATTLARHAYEGGARDDDVEEMVERVLKQDDLESFNSVFFAVGARDDDIYRPNAHLSANQASHLEQENEDAIRVVRSTKPPRDTTPAVHLFSTSTTDLNDEASDSSDVEDFAANPDAIRSSSQFATNSTEDIDVGEHEQSRVKIDRMSSPPSTHFDSSAIFPASPEEEGERLSKSPPRVREARSISPSKFEERRSLSPRRVQQEERSTSPPRAREAHAISPSKFEERSSRSPPRVHLKHSTSTPRVQEKRSTSPPRVREARSISPLKDVEKILFSSPRGQEKYSISPKTEIHPRPISPRDFDELTMKSDVSQEVMEKVSEAVERPVSEEIQASVDDIEALVRDMERAAAVARSATPPRRPRKKNSSPGEQLGWHRGRTPSPMRLPHKRTPSPKRTWADDERLIPVSVSTAEDESVKARLRTVAEREEVADMYSLRHPPRRDDSASRALLALSPNDRRRSLRNATDGFLLRGENDDSTDTGETHLSLGPGTYVIEDR